jgi:hypothetical protein
VSDLTPLVYQYYERYCAPIFDIHTDSELIPVAEGVIQGDPLSPLFFALALQDCLDTTQQVINSGNPEAKIFAYLDDVCILAPAPTTLAAHEHFVKSAAGVGLNVNARKSKVYSVECDPDSLTSVASALGTTANNTGIHLLGSFVGGDNALSMLQMPPSQMIRRLSDIPNLQVRLILLRTSMTQSFMHMMRCTPPDIAKEALVAIDRALSEAVSDILDIPRLPRSVMSEISLPISMGGLGIINHSSTAPYAYIASALGTYQKWRSYLPDNAELLSKWATINPNNALTPALESVNRMLDSARSLRIIRSPRHIVPPRIELLPKFLYTTKLQQQLGTIHHALTYQSLRNTSLTSLDSRAQFNSKTARGAGAFLHALPSDRSLSLSNQDMRTSLYLWLRLSVTNLFNAPRDLSCVCKRPDQIGSGIVTVTDHHVMNCGAENLRSKRHHTVVKVIQEMLQSTHLSPELEPLVDPTNAGHLRYDVSVDAVDSRYTSLKLDITIRNPQARHLVTQAASQQLHAANSGVKDKQQRYGSFVKQGDRFLPIVLETFGGAHNNLFELVALAGKRVNNLAPETATFAAPTFASFWLQRISMALWRENSQLAASIIHRSMDIHGLDRSNEQDIHTSTEIETSADPASAVQENTHLE